MHKQHVFTKISFGTLYTIEVSGDNASVSILFDGEVTRTLSINMQDGRINGVDGCFHSMNIVNAINQGTHTLCDIIAVCIRDDIPLTQWC